ncbi:MAG: heavy-metal-associated domain-containing protein [Planctomycetia bacterium]|nr:heavy-metal-associated domain-containing protein [Planctomycetia bacterium]
MRKSLASLPGVSQVRVDYPTKRAYVTIQADKWDEKALLKALQDAGYGGKVVR